MPSCLVQCYRYLNAARKISPFPYLSEPLEIGHLEREEARTLRLLSQDIDDAHHAHQKDPLFQQSEKKGMGLLGERRQNFDCGSARQGVMPD